MDYAETINYIESLSPTLERPSLLRLELFLAENENPQNRLPFFHVGGTNGKGSTVAILESVLRAAGYKTGRFTGPHILRWNERFHVAGEAISDKEFARLGSKVRVLSEEFARRHADLGALSWFEYLTAMAFFYFLAEKIDVGVLEVGLGGRFDATNVLATPIAVGITSIGLDHTHILGDTIEQIAFEKAGIIKPAVPVVTAATGGALAVIEAQAKERGAPLTKVIASDWQRCRTELTGLSLRGEHQKENALVAIKMLEQSRLLKPAQDSATHPALSEGLKQVFWPGRMQWLAKRNLLVDGAHNIDGALSLRDGLDTLWSGRKARFVFGCYGTKDGNGMLSALIRPGDNVHLAETQSQRATFDNDKLAATMAGLGIRYVVHQSVASALDQALTLRRDDEMVVVTGSFVMVRAAYQALGWARVEDGFEECQQGFD